MHKHVELWGRLNGNDCAYSGRGFKNMTELTRHLRTSHKLDVRKCRQCSAFFFDQASLEGHPHGAAGCPRNGVQKGSGQVQLWYLLYAELYPSDPPPWSPYYPTQEPDMLLHHGAANHTTQDPEKGAGGMETVQDLLPGYLVPARDYEVKILQQLNEPQGIATTAYMPPPQYTAQTPTCLKLKPPENVGHIEDQPERQASHLPFWTEHSELAPGNQGHLRSSVGGIAPLISQESPWDVVLPGNTSAVASPQESRAGSVAFSIEEWASGSSANFHMQPFDGAIYGWTREQELASRDSGYVQPMAESHRTQWAQTDLAFSRESMPQRSNYGDKWALRF